MTTTLQADVFSQAGKKVKTITLPEAIFGVKWNANLVHDVVVAQQGNARANTAHTKNRGEVSGGGKKPWKQKGTGRARHGSTRSPIWTGGGIAHGPRNERDYRRKLNKNVRAKALATVLSRKLDTEALFFVDTFTFEKPKTKDAHAFLSALKENTKKADMLTKKRNAVLVLLPGRDAHTEHSFQNFGNVEVMQIKDVHPVALLTYKYVVVAKPDAALALLTERTSSKSARKATSK